MELNEEKEELRASKSGPPKGGKPVEVKAFYLARGIDIMRVFNNPDLYGKCPQNFDSKSLTITLNEAANEYVTVFNYGSVVMFNVPAAKQNEHLDNIKKNAITTPLGASAMITDEYTLMIHPELEGMSVCVCVSVCVYMCVRVCVSMCVLYMNVCSYAAHLMAPVVNPASNMIVRRFTVCREGSAFKHKATRLEQYNDRCHSNVSNCFS
jgi:hypothetical protein